MPSVTKKECWDLLEDRLYTISETRLGKHVGEAKFAVALLVSAGRDDDVEWVESNLFDFYCKLAGLYAGPTRQLVTRTMKYLKTGRFASFKQNLLEIL